MAPLHLRLYRAPTRKVFRQIAERRRYVTVIACRANDTRQGEDQLFKDKVKASSPGTQHSSIGQLSHMDRRARRTRRAYHGGQKPAAAKLVISPAPSRSLSITNLSHRVVLRSERKPSRRSVSAPRSIRNQSLGQVVVWAALAERPDRCKNRSTARSGMAQCSWMQVSSRSSPKSSPRR